MTRALLCLVITVLGVSCAEATAVSPVQKVIQLIDDMKTKVEGEGKASEDDFAQYAKWCDGEADEKTRAIKDTKAEIQDLSATIADSEAQVSNLETKISELSTTISSTEKELANAASSRDGQHSDFVAAEDELVGTVDTLGHDMTLIKKGMGGASLMQLPKAKREKMQRMVKGLDAVVEAGWVTTQQKKTVSAFLQQKAESEDEDEDMQAPSGGTDGILDAIAGMEEKAEDSLASERKQEMKDQNGYQLLKLALENELKNMKEELAKATSKKQFTLQELAGAKKTLTSAQTSLAEDEKYLRDLKRECQAKATEFEEEYKDRQNELGALGKAKAIMTEKFSFVQTSMTVRVRRSNDLNVRSESDDRKQQALRVLQKLGKQMHSTVLVSLSYRALVDPFAKVKGMIEEMISKLLEEAAAEADQKAFCDKELGESKASIKAKEGKLATVSSRIEKSESAVQKLAEEIKTIGAEVADTNSAVAEATGIRAEEKATFTKTAKDYSESQEACAAAIEVLRSYYESGSFVQVTMKTTLRSRMHMKTRESGDGGGIIGMLEVAESDFSKLLSEAKAAEDAAQSDFDAMVNDSKVLLATKNAELKSKKTETASIKSSLMNYGDDKAGLDSELSAVMEYLDKVKPQCQYQVPTYEERKQRREKEIDGLKEALSVLEGDSV